MPVRLSFVALAIVFGFLALGVLQTLVTQLRCRHEWIFVRGLYGDQINYSGGKRSVWQCSHCDRYTTRKELLEPLSHAPYFPEPEPDAKGLIAAALFDLRCSQNSRVSNVTAMLHAVAPIVEAMFKR